VEERRSIATPSAERRCAARNRRSGERCRKWAAKNQKVCHYHGAHRTRYNAGVRHWNWRNGGRSAVVQTTTRQVAERYVELVNDPRYADLRGEIAAVRMCTERLLQEHRDEHGLKPERNRELQALAETTRRLVLAAHAISTSEQYQITVESFANLMVRIFVVVREEFDEPVAERLVDRIYELMGPQQPGSLLAIGGEVS
jgi:hypothetical protein